MLKNDLVLRNPLRFMGHKTEEILPEGGFGAVLARAGVGKTSLLVQLALNTILRSKNVLHISLDDPANKISLWYKEIFRNFARPYDIKQADQLWESMLPHRFIMTLKAEAFSVSVLEKRLIDLAEQDIFSPRMIIIDGLSFDESVHRLLPDIKTLAKNYSMCIWFTVRTHRHEEPAPDGMPAQLSHVADLFEVVIQLQPKGKEVYVKALKGGPPASDNSALLPCCY